MKIIILIVASLQVNALSLVCGNKPNIEMSESITFFIEEAEKNYVFIRVVVPIPENISVTGVSASVAYFIPSISEYGIAGALPKIERTDDEVIFTISGSPHLAVEARYGVTVYTPTCPILAEGVYKFNKAMKNDGA